MGQPRLPHPFAFFAKGWVAQNWSVDGHIPRLPTSAARINRLSRSSVLLVFMVFLLVGASPVTITIVIVAAPMDLDVSTIKITRGAVAV